MALGTVCSGTSGPRRRLGVICMNAYTRMNAYGVSVKGSGRKGGGGEN